MPNSTLISFLRQHRSHISLRQARSLELLQRLMDFCKKNSALLTRVLHKPEIVCHKKRGFNHARSREFAKLLEGFLKPPHHSLS